MHLILQSLQVYKYQIFSWPSQFPTWRGRACELAIILYQKIKQINVSENSRQHWDCQSGLTKKIIRFTMYSSHQIKYSKIITTKDLASRDNAHTKFSVRMKHNLLKISAVAEVLKASYIGWSKQSECPHEAKPTLNSFYIHSVKASLCLAGKPYVSDRT